MSKTIQCISPVDGSIFAERSALSPDEAKAIVSRARAAQSAWAARPISERINLVRAGIERLGEMNDEVVPELARMMGRPVRYGGEFGGFKERASHMCDIAEESLILVRGRDGEVRALLNVCRHRGSRVCCPETSSG